MATLRQRGLVPSIDLESWHVPASWTPDPGTYAAIPAVIHVRAKDGPDALAKAVSRCAMHEAIAPVTIGTPAEGWVDRT